MWSWVLCIAGATGLWLAGSKRRLGWAICVATEALWVPYGLATKQYGFVAGAFLYGAVKVRNYRAWRDEQRPII